MHAALRPFAALAAMAIPFAARPATQGGSPPDEVEIVYDHHLIPHVFGESDEAAFYGLGYHHMLEFPIGTLNMLWVYSGRMAEVAGPSYIDEDRLLRLWELPAIAQRHKTQLEAQQLLDSLEAYVAGIEAGRSFWRDGGTPAESARIDALFGPTADIRVDPVPDFLNPTFSPFGPGAPIAAQMRAVVNQLFDESKPITVEHVLHLGIAIQSFFLYSGNALPSDKLPPPAGFGAAPAFSEEEETMAPEDDPGMPQSNGWVIGSAASLLRRPLVLSDTHVIFNRVQIRPYLVQVEGDQYAATGLSMPGYPGCFNAFNERLAWTVTASAPVVARNHWLATLLPSVDPEDLSFEFQTGTGVQKVQLERVQDTISWFDPVTGATSSFLDTRYYVPVHPSEGSGLGFERYPVIPQSSSPPLPGTTIRFEQAAFTTQRNFWEWALRMGLADDTDEVREILDEVTALFGDGNNLLVVDRDSNALYALMAGVPIQGAGVDPADYGPNADLDGSRLDQRWQGIHPFADLPTIGPADLSQSHEVWINNNVTPDCVEKARFTEGDLALFPAYMVPHERVTSWRQERTVEVLQDFPYRIPPLYSELVARDMTDIWTHEMWPFFEAAADMAPGGLSANAQLFVDWVNQYRHEDEFGWSNPFYDFVAHRFSRVTVYTVVMRSIYDQILAAQPTNELQESFGEDPAHPLFSAPQDFTYGDYAPNVEAMRGALESITSLWKLGSGPNGFQNQAQLAAWSPLIAGDPWLDPRFDTTRDPEWLGVIAGDKVTRWGHVKMLALTPHAPLIPGVSDINNSIPLFQAFLFASLQPAFLASLPFAFLRTDFYTQQVPQVVPLGGIDRSIFSTRNPLVISDSGPAGGYTQSIYRASPTSLFQFHPHNQGSQTLFSVQLKPTNAWITPPWALFLQAVGGTEITRPDLLGDGLLSYQDRYANMKAFSLGLWHPLITKRAYLGDPTYVLTYPSQ